MASNALGLIQTSNVDLVGQQSRFGIGSRLVLGGGTLWTNDAQGLELQAAMGEPVALEPIGQVGFAPLGGRATTFGLRWRDAQWAYAAQVAAQSDVRELGLGLYGPDGRLQPAATDSQGLLQVLRYQRGDSFAQFNLLSTHGGTPFDTAQPVLPPPNEDLDAGIWFDGALRDGPVEHRLGLNHLPEQHYWLGTPVSSGLSGGYYRWRWDTRSRMFDAQFDAQRLHGSDLGDSRRRAQIWSNWRERDSGSSAYGAQLFALGGGSSTTWSLLGFREQQVGEGSWRYFGGASSNGSEQRSQLDLGIDGTTLWQGLTLAAGAALAGDGRGRPRTDLSASAAGEVATNLTLNLSMRRYSAEDDSAAGHSIYGALSWRLDRRWTVSAAWNESRGPRVPLPPGPVDAPPPIDPQATIAPRQRFGWISLRYEEQAGSPSLALGGRAGQGGGRIAGVLFLDSNGNGRLDPGEPLAPNVSILLDGRYSVQTDALGRFEFPFVGSGEHRLRVVPDNLPLPWAVQDGGVVVRVERRETTQVSIGAARP